MTENTPIKAWRIKKGEPIPQWLQKTENVEITAGCDLIVIEAEVEGFDVYMADPNSTASMMVATRLDLGKSGHIEGAPTNLRTASVILSENKRLKREIDEFPRIGVTKVGIEAAWEEISSHHPDQGYFDADRSITRAALKAAMEAGR